MVGVAKVGRRGRGCGEERVDGRGPDERGDAERARRDDVSWGQAGETAWGHGGPWPLSSDRSTRGWWARLHSFLRDGAPRGRAGRAPVEMGAPWAGGQGGDEVACEG